MFRFGFCLLFFAGVLGSSLIAEPRMTSPTVFTGSLGEAMSYAIEADNQPTGFAATGLPAGVVIDPLTGVISGTPTEAGIFDVVIQAVGADGTVVAHLILVSKGTEQVVFNNNNPAAVSSGPSVPTQFTLSGTTCITYVMDYHYFNGGELPGTIALQHEDGTTYGPWQTAGRIGQGGVFNAYWEAWPNTWLKPGLYTVVDSHNPTWSYNSSSGNAGIATIHGFESNVDDQAVYDALMNACGLTGADAEATADPDGDGRPNWIELFEATDPSRADAGRMGLRIIGDAAGHTIRFPLRGGGVGWAASDYSLDGVRSLIEVSTTLGSGSWMPAIEGLDVAGASETMGAAGIATIEVAVDPAKAGSGPVFVRQRLVNDGLE